MDYCELCPRRCGADRNNGTMGFCGVPLKPVVARAAAHFGEEPCISGHRGSGAVFFTGCNLRCVYCQNGALSRAEIGKQITVSRLKDIFLELQDQGVHNINLVTPSHYADAIAEALWGISLDIPVVWNSSGYDSVDTLKRLDGLIQIYMPDLKYLDVALSARYSSAPDYPTIATSAIREMFRQTGPFLLNQDGILQRGILIRHLILPNQSENSKRVIDWVADNFEPDDVLFSLMSQYTPMGDLTAFPELQHRVSPDLDSEIYQYLMSSRIENGYYQDSESATEEMIPAFDNTGV